MATDRVLVLNPAVQSEALRLLMESMADMPEPPASWHGRLRDEFSARAVWPPVQGRCSQGSAWFRILGFGVGVHTASSPVGRRVSAGLGIGGRFRRCGRWFFRLLGPDFHDLGRAWRFVRRGEWL